MAASEVKLRPMTMEDYDAVYEVWKSISGFGIRSIDDSREGIARFLLRNKDLSVVAEIDGKIIGSILCGHDGRRGCLYHVCVTKEYRMLGIGQQMVTFCKKALKEEGINRINLIAFTSNEIGNKFWQKLKWNYRTDCNYYEENLNESNITTFVP